MRAERWQQIEDVVQAALEREPEEWPAFLDEACRNDSALRAEVESFLKYHERADGFIESPAFASVDELLTEIEEDSLEGRKIGSYKILRQIGHGGMGAVYLAARADDQYEKQVAIKVVKRGLDTNDNLRHFRHERQILATLDHPNIARLTDGGSTEDGLPYFVMEYVEGLPIIRYCDEHKVNVTERLVLFRTVCSAVHYAHQHLVIHRDLKPSNILVTNNGVTKLLDFGIAKLLDTDLSQTVGHTITELRVMTPEYASPEQVKGENVTTSSDVYSLGVLLYELTTGHRPYQFKNRRPDQIARVICEVEPEKPSTAMSRREAPSTNGKGPVKITPESVSESREGAPERLRRRLAGDLDNIVLMAMRKEPQRRYASVEQFSEDIRRHLEGLPVVAHKDTFSYRASKFVRRNRAGVAAATLIILAVLAGIITTVWQARIAARQSRLAATERDHALASQEKAERISAYMRNILAQANPSWYTQGKHKGPNTPIIEVVDDAAQRIDSEFADQPEIRADLHHTIGDTYRALGQLDAAETHLKESLEIRSQLFGEDNVKVAEAYYYVAAIQQTKGDYVAAEDSFRKALTIQRARPNEGNNLPYMLADFAGVMMAKGDLQTAESLTRESLGLFRARYGDNHSMVANAYQELAQICLARGDVKCASEMLQEANHRSVDPNGVNLLSLQAKLDEMSGRYKEAESLLHRADESLRKELGDNIQRRALLLDQLAYVLYLDGDYHLSETENQESWEIAKGSFPANHITQSFPLALRSLLLTKQGKYPRAEVNAREALKIYRSNSSQSAELLVRINAALVGSLIAQHRYGEAETVLQESSDGLKSSLGEQSYWTREAAKQLALVFKETQASTRGERRSEP